MKLREAQAEDVTLVISFLVAMLEEMASLGGEPLGEKSDITNYLSTRFSDQVADKNNLYLLAQVEGGKKPAGLLEARITTPEMIFKAARRLHISALYVVPAFRGKGIGESLTETAIRWGQENGCNEIELNVLVDNPARKLYEKLGFKPFEINMRMEK